MPVAIGEPVDGGGEHNAVVGLVVGSQREPRLPTLQRGGRTFQGRGLRALNIHLDEIHALQAKLGHELIDGGERG